MPRHQINLDRLVIQILMMKQILVVKEDGMGGDLLKKLIFYPLLLRHTQSVQSLEESKLILNKHRLLYANLIQRKELRKISYVDLITIK